jgi:hypothetical protein
MPRLRSLALAALVLDVAIAVGGLLVMGGAAEASAPTPTVRYVPSPSGCAMLRATGETVWRYEGLVDGAACAAAAAAQW